MSDESTPSLQEGPIPIVPFTPPPGHTAYRQKSLFDPGNPPEFDCFAGTCRDKGVVDGRFVKLHGKQNR